MGNASSFLQGMCGFDSVDPTEEDLDQTTQVNNNSKERELIKLEQPKLKEEVLSKVPPGDKKSPHSIQGESNISNKEIKCDKPLIQKEVSSSKNIHTATERCCVDTVESIDSVIPTVQHSVPELNTEEQNKTIEVQPQIEKVEKRSSVFFVEREFVESSVRNSANLSPLVHHKNTIVTSVSEGENITFTSEQSSNLQEVTSEVTSSGHFRIEKQIVTHIVQDFNLCETMEGVDTIASEQVDIDSVQISDEIDTEALNALVGQLTAQRETTPDDEDDVGSDTGSMQASTGSEGLEEQLNSNLVISDNGENKSNGDIETEKPQKEQNAKSEQKSGTKEKTKEEKSSKSKKKEDKTIDHILRALSSLQSTEEKLAALCKKYADLHEEHRVLQSTFKQSQRKLTVVTREKDQLQSEHTKAVMAKSKLEGLCRELQKHNTVIRQESLQRAREEDEKRKEISNKFQTTIGEIQQQMQDHHERNMKLREENQELAGKLKQFIEQYESREKQVEKVMQHRELEQKLADAKLQQASALLLEEQERGKKEKELLFLQATEGQKKATLLEAQLGMYKERYEEFQTTINKSNEMFQKFKTEMDKMTKRIKKLEKEGASWKSKWEKSNKALLEMAEEKANADKEKQLLANKIQKLESLCRAMQAERLGRKVIEASGYDMSKLEGDSGQPSSTPSEHPSSAPSEHLPATDSPPQADGGAGAEGGETQTCPADSTTQDSTENCECSNDSSEGNQSDGSGGCEAANDVPSEDQPNQSDATSATDEKSSPDQKEPVESSQT